MSFFPHLVSPWNRDMNYRFNWFRNKIQYNMPILLHIEIKIRRNQHILSAVLHHSGTVLLSCPRPAYFYVSQLYHLRPDQTRSVIWGPLFFFGNDQDRSGTWFKWENSNVSYTYSFALFRICLWYLLVSIRQSGFTFLSPFRTRITVSPSPPRADRSFVWRFFEQCVLIALINYVLSFVNFSLTLFPFEWWKWNCSYE